MSQVSVLFSTHSPKIWVFGCCGLHVECTVVTAMAHNFELASWYPKTVLRILY
jgi:hypothetical protein